MIIDFHTHAFPAAIAEDAMTNLEKTAELTPYGNGTIEALLERNQKRGIAKSVLLNIAVSTKSVTRMNDFAIEMANREASLLPFGTLHPELKNWEAEMLRLKENGIKGIKLHPCYQKFEMNDQKVYPMYEAITAQEMIVLFHGGLDPLDMSKDYASPKAILQVKQNFPQMKMVVAHAGAAFSFDAAEEYLWGQEIYLDISFIGGRMGMAQFQRFINMHDADRILYGSDYPWHDEEELLLLKNAALPEALQEKILYGNAKRLLGEA
ncbi:MAG: amidohydrolase family protein [Christensenellaceae bacterium]|jgi:predicted TIM-barrel fold metal-dependent hydrolase